MHLLFKVELVFDCVSLFNVNKCKSFELTHFVQFLGVKGFFNNVVLLSILHNNNVVKAIQSLFTDTCMELYAVCIV